jgi:hypothetical protein
MASMRHVASPILASLFALVSVVAIAGCASSSTSLAPSPRTTAQRATTLRNLHAGDRISFSCGVAVRVPRGYRGWYGQSTSNDVDRDIMESSVVAQKGLLYSFAVQSLTQSGQKIVLRFPDRFPVVARSLDGAVEVHARQLPVLRHPFTWIDVILRIPGHVAGVVSMMAPAKQAKTHADVLRVAGTMWTRFSVSGVVLPTLATRTDPFSGTWKSNSTGAVLKIVKSGGGWEITDSKGHTGRAVVRGSELVSDGDAFKQDGPRLAYFSDGRRVMEFLRQ